jgi:hypothetical protein
VFFKLKENVVFKNELRYFLLPDIIPFSCSNKNLLLPKSFIRLVIFETRTKYLYFKNKLCYFFLLDPVAFGHPAFLSWSTILAQFFSPNLA